ncbi:MAG: NAD-dependent epimerase/dehydratase family protein [Cyclobacteriaceae bacterium]|jgi:nucleoside-diphosphate-sugar epimerase|nr:NAD-dependent epimerase/dehydratase family protein [Cyclobacteriaceae bacterium]
MIAVTGATGLLGRFICAHFASLGVRVVGVCRSSSAKLPQAGVAWREADLADPLAVARALEGADTVIHAAATVSFDPRQRQAIMETNVQGTAHVVNACLELGTRHLIHVSSVAALGRSKGTTHIDEKATWSDESLESDYGISKHQAELEVFRGQEEGLRVSIINPSMILAPVVNGRSSARLFDYVWQGRAFYPTGSINYVDVRDVVAAIELLYQTPRPGQRYILNAGSVPYGEMFREIARRLEKKPPFVQVPYWAAVAAGWASETWAAVRGREPLVSRQTARLAKETFHFENKKAVNQLGMAFRPLAETLDWCCAAYRLEHTTNN